MPARRALVIISGRVQQLPTGDTLEGVSGAGGAEFYSTRHTYNGSAITLVWTPRGQIQVFNVATAEMLTAGTHYTLSGNTLTVTGGAQNGDVLVVTGVQSAQGGGGGGGGGGANEATIAARVWFGA